MNKASTKMVQYIKNVFTVTKWYRKCYLYSRKYVIKGLSDDHLEVRYSIDRPKIPQSSAFIDQ